MYLEVLFKRKKFMNNSNNISCETITKLNQESQNQRLRLFAKVDISTKLKILDKQKELFHKLKSAYSDIDNVILGYYGFRELYVNHNPYKLSCMNDCRFNDPIFLNIKTKQVEYRHLYNNEKLGYPRIKIFDNYLLVEADQNKLIDYCYTIPLENNN